MTFPRCMRTQPKPWLEASQYTTKSSWPSSKVKTGALHNLSFKVSKACFCLSPHSNGLPFCVKAVKGTAILEKFEMKRR